MGSCCGVCMGSLAPGISVAWTWFLYCHEACVFLWAVWHLKRIGACLGKCLTRTAGQWLVSKAKRFIESEALDLIVQLHVATCPTCQSHFFVVGVHGNRASLSIVFVGIAMQQLCRASFEKIEHVDILAFPTATVSDWSCIAPFVHAGPAFGWAEFRKFAPIGWSWSWDTLSANVGWSVVGCIECQCRAFGPFAS